MSTPENNSASTQSKDQQLGGLVARIYWLVLGNLLLFVFFALIMQGKLPIITDALMWVTVVSMLVVRSIDIKKYEGSTFENKPATMDDFKSWAIKLVVVAALLHGGARALASSGLL